MTASEIMSRTLAGRPEGMEKPSAAACVKAWWRACRPPFLITAAIPVALAMAFVYRVNGGLTAAMWLRFGVLLFGCFLGLTIANFANDLFDHVLGVDDQEDSIGGTGVIPAVSSFSPFFSSAPPRWPSAWASSLLFPGH